MTYWFTTSHGNTCHNEPGTPNYVEGEPPKFPLTIINYRGQCLEDGFARIGYPNTGDLNELGRARLAPNGYSFYDIASISKSPLTQNQLKKFSSILAGDYILIPADEGEFEIHFGLVLTIRRDVIPPYINPRPKAYYYYHDISNGAYYECAHRINVKWCMEENRDFREFYVPEIGGLWRQAFGQLSKTPESLRAVVSKSECSFFNK
jgi:hypothetical protein